MRRHIERGQKLSSSSWKQLTRSGLVKLGMLRGCCYGLCVKKRCSGGISKGPPEIPPDNNRAEGLERLAVTKRKVCGGSRSMDGFGDTADLLSVIQTCRAQGRSGKRVL